MSSLTKSAIINGANTLAVAEQDGIYRSLQPVETMTEIVFSNLAANTTKRFKLSNLLKTNYRAIGFNYDVVSDDAESIPNSTSDPSIPFVTIHFKSFRNGKGTFLLRQQGGGNEPYVAHFYLLQAEELEIRSSVALNNITLECVPVIVEPAIIFP